jgi:hypothetical protein
LQAFRQVRDDLQSRLRSFVDLVRPRS